LSNKAALFENKRALLGNKRSLLKKDGNCFVVPNYICTFAIGWGRNPDHNEAFAIISR
jgi:hypothetical protein